VTVAAVHLSVSTFPPPGGPVREALVNGEAHLYDRLTGEGYYRNAFNCPTLRRLLLEPAGPDGTGQCALCAIDPITQEEPRILRAA
jgi:hypothetical protein